MLTQLALAPAMVLVIFLLHFDRYTKEPLWLMILFFIYGMFSVVPVMAFCSCLLKTNLQNEIPVIYKAFLSSALPEEFMKAVFIFFMFLDNKYINEPFDFIVYPCIFSLGFSAAENLVYVYHPILGGVSTAITRAAFSTPGHFIFGICLGYYFAGGRKINLCCINIIKAFLFSTLLHGVYNLILVCMGRWYIVLLAPYLIFLWKKGLYNMLCMHINNHVNIS